MISINSVLEVDLLGQANAEHLEGATFFGTVGQLDFVRGAFASRGGKSVLAFYSSAKGGTISRVVPRLPRWRAVPGNPLGSVAPLYSTQVWVGNIP